MRYKIFISSFIQTFSQKLQSTDWIWTVGAVSLLTMVLLVVSGLLMAVDYMPSFQEAFLSVSEMSEAGGMKIFVHKAHGALASCFFIAVYVHIGRVMYNGSYKKPKRFAWVMGVLLFGLLLLTAMTGYALPRGQMGHWAMVVVTNLVKEIPYIGPRFQLGEGDRAVQNLFLIHFMVPFASLFLVFVHIAFLRAKKTRQIFITEKRVEQDRVVARAHIKNFLYIMAFLVFCAVLLVYKPDLLASRGNDIPADLGFTPDLIKPEWYLLPFFAMLRCVSGDLIIPFTSVVLLTATQLGALIAFGSLGVLFFLPFLNFFKES